MSDLFLTPGTLKAGTTSVSVYFELEDTTTGAATTGKVGADMVGSYWRQGGVRVSITVSDLAAVNSAYSSGGVKEVDATNMPGLYRLDLPDAAVATGADWVVAQIKVSGCKASRVRLALPTYAALRDAIMAKVIESAGSYTAQQALSIILAAVAGQTASSGATFKTPDGSLTRIAGTVDGSNNRTAVTLTPSS